MKMAGISIPFILMYALLLSSLLKSALSQQPNVTMLEGLPSRRSAGIISLPEGSPWCEGRPTNWLPGHHNHEPDVPNCLVRGKWRPAKRAVLDELDVLNARDTPFVIDRHDCGAIDANGDGRIDIYCTVGADRGTGVGWNELYLTRKDGSLFKIVRHGLQRFNTMRTRHTTILRGANGTEFVFITANHGRREDGRPNKHKMFQKTGKWHRNPNKRYFTSIPGPWERHSDTGCAISADINGDGLDDLIVCNKGRAAFILAQRRVGVGKFLKNIPLRDPSLRNWRNARVADVDGDGILDLAVVYFGDTKSLLRVFKGIRRRPYFKFDSSGYFSLELPFAAPDLEAFDANSDGKTDLYIVQTDERRKEPDGSFREGSYCGGRKLIPQEWWSGGPNRITPPNDYVPPNDMAPDLLLLGNPGAPYAERFTRVEMLHREPGCGYRVKKFGNNSLVLAQGSFDRPGHQLFLDWKEVF